MATLPATLPATITLNYATPAVGQFATQPAYSRITCQWDDQALRLTEPPDGKSRPLHWMVGIPLVLLGILLLTAGLTALQHDPPIDCFPYFIFGSLTLISGALAIGEGHAQRHRPLIIEVTAGQLTIHRPTILWPKRQWKITRIRRVCTDPAGIDLPTFTSLASLTVQERLFWRRIRVMTRRSEECKWIAALVNAAIAAQRT